MLKRGGAVKRAVKIPRKNKYSSLKQALEQRMLFDATLVPPPGDAAVTGTNEATAHEVLQAVPKPQHPVQPIEKTLNPDEMAYTEIQKTSTDVTSKASNTDRLLEFHAFKPSNRELVLSMQG